jgi:hypothetical protein
MSIEQRDHQTAVNWIEGEIDNMIRNLGKPNASSAATSSITLAFMLRAINEDEHRHYRARIDQIYATYNASITQGVAA